MITAYASIGNSDDKLGQQGWSDFQRALLHAIRKSAHQIHGEWFSAPASNFQNACCCFEIEEAKLRDLRAALSVVAGNYEQDSIALAIAMTTEFIGPQP
jgi:hypothetical protein